MAMKITSMAQASSLKYQKHMFSSFDPEILNVIKCYGDKVTIGGEGEKIYNLFLEFCSGGSLFDYINKSYSILNGLVEQEVKKYTRDIIKGLFYIHGNEIGHCGIKPENILLVPGSGGGFTTKLADFGCAKSMDDANMDDDSYRGTCSYMAPELVKDKILAYPADIWALGCVVVEMLSEKPAWEYEAREDILLHIGYTKEVPIFPKNISEDARDFMYKCFIRDFIWRWTAEELLEHLFLVLLKTRAVDLQISLLTSVL